MLSQRLSLALESSAIELPEKGQIAVIGAKAGEPLACLPKDRVEIVQRRFPDYAYFRDGGFAVAMSLGGPYAMSIVALPRAKAEALLTLSQAAAATQGPLVVDGQKTDGIASILKAARSAGNVGEVISKSHGKLFVVTNRDFSDWQAVPTAKIAGRFATAPGVFSADAIDPGSKALAACLPPKLSGRVVDLGAGWGYLSDAILGRENVTQVDLVEADFVALEAARQNITDARAEFHWADALNWQVGGPVDHVVTNPPFHHGRSPDPSLGQAFIHSAARLLKPKGKLWLVANRHLPYEQALEDAFHTVRSLGLTSSFKIFLAASPKRRKTG